MKNSVLTLALLLFASFGVFAQGANKEDIDSKEFDALVKRMKAIEVKNQQLESEVRALKVKLSDFEVKADNLINQTQANSSAIDQAAQAANELELKITSAEETTNQKISEVDTSIGKTMLWSIIGILAALIVFIVLGIVYFLLRRKQKSDKTDVIEQLSETKSSIETGVIEQLSETKSSIRTDMITQLNRTKSSIEMEVTEKLNKTKSSIEEDLTKELGKQTESLKELLAPKKKTTKSSKKDSTKE